MKNKLIVLMVLLTIFLLLVLMGHGTAQQKIFNSPNSLADNTEAANLKWEPQPQDVIIECLNLQSTYIMDLSNLLNAQEWLLKS